MNEVLLMRTFSERSLFCKKFKVPASLAQFVPRLFSDEEIDAALANDKDFFASPDYEKSWLETEYKKGFLNKTDQDGVFRLNTLYGMLDVFVVSRKEDYDRLFTIEEKHQLDDWYFDAYFDSLSPDAEGRLTEDKVMTLNETIEAIKSDPRQIYLNNCDCRSLTGSCGMPVRTCLTYKNGPNTFVDRGLSRSLTKEEAVEVVRMADKAGLMHTTMSGGICNCCPDCCYLFRSQRRAATYGIWPEPRGLISYDPEKCVFCGLCAQRCQMGVFKSEKSILFDPGRCAGCGLCVSTCPAGALKLTKRGCKT